MTDLSEQAEAEAARRYPDWGTPSADQERHRAGYWAFVAGADWSGRLADPANDD